MIATRVILSLQAAALIAACSDSGDNGGGAGSGGQSSGGTLARGSGGTNADSCAGTGGRDSSAGSAGTGGSGGRPPADSSVDRADTGGTMNDAGALCSERTGGALIRFAIGNESLTVWVTNDSFIAEAERLRMAGERRIPSFALLDDTDCDPQWTWHVDPASVAFADVTIEVCDGLPSHIENDKRYWLETLGSYCPWSARVVSVDDRP
jgi:hypothetical protein